MASRKFTEDERKIKALEIARYIIKECNENHKISTRTLGEIFGISNYTVSILMGKYLKKISPNLYDQVRQIIEKNVPQSYNDDEVRKRVLMAANLIVEGKNVNDIAQILNVTENVINEDLQTRLKKINSELYSIVKEIQEQRSLNNLRQGCKK